MHLESAHSSRLLGYAFVKLSNLCSGGCGVTGQPLLLPITNSLYVNGKISNNGNILVDIGTGYYVEVRPALKPGKFKQSPFICRTEQDG
jgi:hypothetical protein